MKNRGQDCVEINKLLKVADLIHNEPKACDKIVGYLRIVKYPEDLDLIIALGMAKEGFDWAFCEHALTVGYRGSLTEIIKIIGRCTRERRKAEERDGENHRSIVANGEGAGVLSAIAGL